jgi:K+-sensing histidine kinase KdpD
MRADKHYVEMLDDGPSQRSTADIPPAAPASRQAEPVKAPDESALVAAQAGRDLAKSLTALRASTNLLSERGPALASAVAANLIRAEAWRATCLLRIAQFLRGEVTPAIRPVRARAIVDQVLMSIEPERRLRGVTVDARIDVGDTEIGVDEDLLVSALSGVLLASIGLAPEQSEFTVSLAVGVRGNDVTFAIVQEQARVPAGWAGEPFAAGAARIAGSWQGRLALVTSTGSDVRLTIPRLS